MKRKNAYLTEEQLITIKSKLLREKEKLIIKDVEKESFCLDKNELSDVLDEASINIEASKMLRFRNRELFYLRKIENSLERIENDSYGLCSDCNGQIAFERLLARPTAELCIGCKEEAELSEKNNIYHRQSKSLGKTIYEIGRR